MFIWKNTETGEELKNESNQISVGSDGTGEITYAYLGNSNVILFSLSGNAEVESIFYIMLVVKGKTGLCR